MYFILCWDRQGECRGTMPGRRTTHFHKYYFDMDISFIMHLNDWNLLCTLLRPFLRRACLNLFIHAVSVVFVYTKVTRLFLMFLRRMQNLIYKGARYCCSENNSGESH